MTGTWMLTKAQHVRLHDGGWRQEEDEQETTATMGGWE